MTLPSVPKILLGFAKYFRLCLPNIGSRETFHVYHSGKLSYLVSWRFYGIYSAVFFNPIGLEKKVTLVINKIYFGDIFFFFKTNSCEKLSGACKLLVIGLLNDQ